MIGHGGQIQGRIPGRQESWRGDNGPTDAHTFAAVGETLVWTCALDDLFESTSSTYASEREADADGQLLSGLRHARNAAVHGEVVAGVTMVTGGLGAFMLGADALGGSSLWWAHLTWVGRSKTQAERYETQLAGARVEPLLERALNFLRGLL
jgi:hypothetical protein